MTAMSACTPSLVPLSIVSVRKSGVALGADDLGGRRLQVRPIAQLEQPLEAARCDRRARAAPAAPPARRRARASARRSRPRRRAGRRSRSRRAGRPTTPADAPRCTSANTPKVTASSTGTPAARVDLRGDEEDVSEHDRQEQIAGALADVEDGHRLVDRNLPQQVEVRQHLAGAEHDRRQRILGHRERQAGLLAQPLVEILQHRAAAGQHDAAIDDVGRQLGRRALERDAHGVDDDVDGFGQRLADLLVA